jgi:catechol 2,3-dioxygenase-like lactoylglutathione lyase family enzyme
MPSATIRIARPTNDISTLSAFYTSALGLRVIGSFTNHAGFDGIMLGHAHYAWHLEFTHQHGVTIDVRPPSNEHLLVFYLPDKAEWEAAVARVERAGGKRVESENPYWDVCGVTFADPEGWRFVLQNAGWSVGD